MEIGLDVYTIYRIGRSETVKMLPIILVLLVVSSACAAPSVTVDAYDVNGIPPYPDNGKPSSVIGNVFDIIVDGGDTNIYTQVIRESISDLSSQPDPTSQALAVGQSVAVLGELLYGIPGDSCTAAALVNAYASGNKASIRNAFFNYAQTLLSNVDAIAQLVQNPNSIRYTNGRRGNCAANGRTYQFEAAWDIILSNANPFVAGLINEQYCSAKRLYNAFNIRSNNVGAAITASSLPAVNQIFKGAKGSLFNFFRTIANNGNVAAAAAAAKAELTRAISRVELP